VRRAVLTSASALLLGGPTALAFFSGGYFAQPRLWAALGAWLLVLLVAALGPRPFPASAAGRLAVAGLALMTVWSALSLTWAPIAGAALDSIQRLVLYLGALLAAIGLLRNRRVARGLEPALALGATVVIAEGLSGRLLPGVITLERSFRAGTRLDQPITYWNAEGALAAVGLVLCARLVGDRTRPLALRALVAAACTPLAAGVYLSYSRGAIAAVVLGLLILLAVAPTWAQLRGVGVALLAAVLGATAAAVMPGVASLSGALAARERDGAIVLAALLGISAGAALLTAWLHRSELRGRLPVRRIASAGRLSAVAVAVAVLIAMGLVGASLQERGDRSLRNSVGASRLTSVKSNRYEYWRVGLRSFVDNPLRGVGAGGFRVQWLRERPINEGVLDVHSLELEMACELGLVGLLALGLLIGGVAGAGRGAMRRDPPLAAGCIAATSTWLLHASIDWDWQVPAVTLPAILMAAMLVDVAESDAESHPAPPASWAEGETALSPAVSAARG
jgi:O-antigen ligase